MRAAILVGSCIIAGAILLIYADAIMDDPPTVRAKGRSWGPGLNADPSENGYDTGRAA